MAINQADPMHDLLMVSHRTKALYIAGTSTVQMEMHWARMHP